MTVAIIVQVENSTGHVITIRNTDQVININVVADLNKSSKWTTSKGHMYSECHYNNENVEYRSSYCDLSQPQP